MVDAVRDRKSVIHGHAEISVIAAVLEESRVRRACDAGGNRARRSLVEAILRGPDLPSRIGITRSAAIHPDRHLSRCSLRATQRTKKYQDAKNFPHDSPQNLVSLSGLRCSSEERPERESLLATSPA